MNAYDNEILQEVSHNLAELGVREDDAELIRHVAQQWALLIPENPDSDPANSTTQRAPDTK